MAVIDISDEKQAFLTAIYGRDVRSSLVSLAEKLTEACDDAIENQLISVDDTLSESGQGADAAAVGLKLREINKVSVAEDEQHTTITVDSDGSTEYYVVPNDGMIGRMSALETDNKGTVVGAINELKSEIETIQPDFSDGSVTTAKLADHAVTMDKTDFYYQANLSAEYSWLTFTGGEGAIAKASITVENLETAVSEMPDLFSMVCLVNTQYWSASNTARFQSRSSSWQYTYRGVTHDINTITYDGNTYAVLSFTKENFVTAYNSYLSDIDGDLIGMGFSISMGNVAGAFVGTPFAIAGEVTAELIESNFSTTVISEDFVTAVQRAMEEEGGTSTDEETAKNRLTGKVMINLGDSYTKGMQSSLATLATKYGMVADNRGVVSSSICGDTSGNKGFNPMWSRANTIVSDYASGYTINGTSYTASQVAIITFMGGANDGYGVETWIGTGIHETSKETIYGACNHIFNVLAENFPNAKLICITQPAHYNLTVSSITDDATAQTLGFENLAELQQFDDIQLSAYSMAQKENAVRNTANMYGWNVIDMFKDMPTIFNPSNRSAYWNSDKLHLSTGGYALIINALDKKIVELVVG